ncbi:MAG: DUF2914 domain-containing protein [Methylobacter sp.]
MSEKRNIVIKVKLAGKTPENFEPNVVTEWNIKRIAIAVAAMILVLFFLIYLISDDADESGTDNTAAIPRTQVNETEIKDLDIPKQTEQQFNTPVKPGKEPNRKDKPIDDIKNKAVLKKKPEQRAGKEHEYSASPRNVVRTALTYEIHNKEPAGVAVHTVNVSHKKPVWVYYFTELKAMSGNRVYYEWLKNGSIVSKQTLVISKDAWPASSRKLISDSEKGNWAVRLVDEKGQLLNEKTFKVE